MSEIRETLLDNILSSGVLRLNQKQKDLLTAEPMEAFVRIHILEHTYFSIKGTAYDYLQFRLEMNRSKKDDLFIKLKKALCYKFKTYFRRLKREGKITKYNKNTYIKTTEYNDSL